MNCKTVMRMLSFLAIGALSASAEVALPEGYAPLDWIQSTGTQWIDTGVEADSTTTLDMSFGHVKYSNNQEMTIFGANRWAGNAYLFIFQANNIRFYGDGSNMLAADQTGAADYRFVLKSGNTADLYQDGTLKVTDKAVSRASQASDKRLLIFNQKGADRDLGKYRLYALKIGDDDGTQLRDFVPCRDPDGVAGLWDKVEGKFYGNAGDVGQFIGSDNPNEPITATWLGDGTSSVGEAANWECRDADGNVVADALPTAATTVTIPGGSVLNVPAGTEGFKHAQIIGDGLGDDCDWRGQGPVQLSSDWGLNLNGHTLTMHSTIGGGTLKNTEVYKFYRFKIDKVRSGSLCQISDLRLYRGDENVTTQYKAMTSGMQTTGNEGALKLVDNNTGTKWCWTFAADTAWVALEYDKPIQITKYEWYTGNDTSKNTGRNPTAWKFQGSNDGTTWKDLHATSGQNPTNKDKTLAYTGLPAYPNPATGALRVDVGAADAVWPFDSAVVQTRIEVVSGTLKPTLGSTHGFGVTFAAGTKAMIDVTETTDGVLWTAQGGITLPESTVATDVISLSDPRRPVKLSDDGTQVLLRDEVTDNYRELTENEDWTSAGVVTLAQDAHVSLREHELAVRDLTGAGEIINMAGFRYYRFKVDDVRDPSKYQIQLSEVKLYSGETDVTASRTNLIQGMIDEKVDESMAMLADGSTSTKWCKNFATLDDAWITLAYAEPVVVTKYEWYTANDTASNAWRNPQSWRLFGSNDNVHWQELDVVTGAMPTTANYTLAWTGYLSMAEEREGVVRFVVPADETAEPYPTTLRGGYTIAKDGEGQLLLSELPLFGGKLLINEGSAKMAVGFALKGSLELKAGTKLFFDVTAETQGVLVSTERGITLPEGADVSEFVILSDPTKGVKLSDDGKTIGVADNTPLTATWIGDRREPQSFDVADPANWCCTNALGDRITAAVLPVETTTLVLPDGCTFRCAAGTTIPCKDVVYPASLGGDCDWSALTVPMAGMIDLKGHTLTVASLKGSGTITDTVGFGTVNVIGTAADGVGAELGTMGIKGSVKVRKSGTGVATADDKVFYGANDIVISGGTLKVGTRDLSPYLATKVTTTSKDSKTKIWQNVDLTDVFGVRAACASGYSWNNSVISPFLWTKDETSASVQFQLAYTSQTKESEVIFSQVGRDVSAYIQAYHYVDLYQLGLDWHNWSGTVKVATYVPENIQPVCYNSIPLTTEFQNVWKDVKLSSVTGCAGFFAGLSCKGMYQSNGYHWAYDAATDTATVQMQYADGTSTKVVALELKQNGVFVQARAVKAGSGALADYPLGSDLSNPPTAATVASTPTEEDYCIFGLRPLPYGDCSGVITITDGGRLDIAGVSNANSLDNAEMTHGKLISIAGDGPDGKGALYNSGMTTDATTYSGPSFGRIILTDDASVGGVSRMDIRMLAGSKVASNEADCWIEGGHTLTVKDMGVGYFGMWKMSYKLDKMRVTGQASFESPLNGTITNGVWIADGAWVQFHAATVGAGIPFIVEEDATAAVNASSASTVNSAFTVNAGATLSVTNTGDLTFAGAVTNLGAVAQTGAKILYLNGALAGNGSFAGPKVRFGGTANRWIITANDAGLTSRVDFTGVTDAELFKGLKTIDFTYTGEDLGSGKTYALGPAGALTSADLPNITLDVKGATDEAISEGNYLTIDEGVLTLHVADSRKPVLAVWTGAVDNDLANPANWSCTNEFGTVAEGQIPLAYTDVRLVLSPSAFSCPAGTAFDCRSIELGDVTLSDDCDWRGLDLAKVTAGGTIDLNGHDLRISLAATPTMPVTFTDSTAEASAAGTLHVEVPSGKTINFGTYAFTGTVRVAKELAGTLELPAATAYAATGDLTVTDATTVKATGAVTLGGGAATVKALDCKSVLNLNGQTVAVKTIYDQGTLVNTASGLATVVLGRGDTDATLGFVPPANTKLKKEGTGTLTVNGALGSDLEIANGAVVCQRPAYRHYRFVILRAYGSACNSVQFSEFRLLNGETDVTSLRSGFSFTGTQDVSATNQRDFPATERPENAVDGTMETKYLDRRLAVGTYAANKGDVYIQLDYAAPQAITAYDWATANDSPNNGKNNDGRDPADWLLLASDDGETWVTLDKRTGYNATSTRKTWVGPFALPSGGAASVNVTGEQKETSLTLDGVTLAMNNRLGVGQLAFANGGVLEVSAGAATAAMTGSGEIIKRGSGEATVQGPFAGNVGITVTEGRLLVLPDLAQCKWFRFSIKQIEGSDTMQISEFALYDANGNRVNKNLSKGASAATLSAGSCFASHAGNKNEEWEKLFDDATSTKWCVSKNAPSPATASTWEVVTMRLADTAAPVASYNLANAGDSGSYPSRNPKTWSLEASVDGENWVVIDERAIGQGPHANNTWYNGNTPYVPFGVAVASSAAAPSLGTVRVAKGAELNLLTAVPVSGLEVNATTGAGSVNRLQLAPGGTLDLVNVTGDLPRIYAVPLTIGELTGSTAGWRVRVNGTRQPGLGMKIVGNVLYVQRTGFAVYVR